MKFVSSIISTDIRNVLNDSFGSQCRTTELLSPMAQSTVRTEACMYTIEDALYYNITSEVLLVVLSNY